MRKARDYCVVCVCAGYRVWQCLCAECVVVLVYDKIDCEEDDDNVHTKLFTQSRAHTVIVLYKTERCLCVRVCVRLYLSTA